MIDPPFSTTEAAPLVLSAAIAAGPSVPDQPRRGAEKTCSVPAHGHDPSGVVTGATVVIAISAPAIENPATNWRGAPFSSSAEGDCPRRHPPPGSVNTYGG